MNTKIETKRPLKVEYQTYEGGDSPLPFGAKKKDLEKGNIVTKDQFGGVQVYENQEEFEKYHGELVTPCDGDNTMITTPFKNFVFNQTMPVSEPCEAFYRVRKRVAGDAISAKITKLSMERISEDTTDDRLNEISDEIFELEDKLREKYNEKELYKKLVIASIVGSDLEKGSIIKDGEEFSKDTEDENGKTVSFYDDVFDSFYDGLPYAIKEKLSVNALSLMSIQTDELGN